MKKIVSLLLSALTLFGPTTTALCRPLTLEQSKTPERLPQTLEDRFVQTFEILSNHCNDNPKVLEAAGQLFFQLVQSYHKGEGMIEQDLIGILDAVQFAAEKHQDQTRKDVDETPYIIHPLGVTHHLFVIGKVLDPEILMSALLHDTVEDTDTSSEEIRAAFGERVEGFVQEVTDDKTLPKEERKRLQILNAPHKSAGAAQIKLADKLYNLNDLFNAPPPDWDPARIEEYFNWAEQVVDGLPCVNGPLKEAVDQTIAAYRTRTAQIT